MCYNTYMLYQTIKDRFDFYTANVEHWNHNLRGPVIGILSRACGSHENRHLLQLQLTGHASSSDFTAEQWYALYRFVAPSSDGGEWHSEHPLPELCKIVVAHAIANGLSIPKKEILKEDPLEEE